MYDFENIIENTLIGMGYELVDLELDHKKTLRVFIDNEKGITIDDCVLVSNHLNNLLTVENVDYNRLEISSPGVDRIIKKEKDFLKFINHDIKVKTKEIINNKKVFIGKLKSYENKKISLQLNDNTLIEIDLNNINTARLKPNL